MAVPSAVAGLLRRPARLGDEVHSAIFARIMSRELVPGERISVDALAREIGVSQTPIREALSRLESEGLVSKTHLVGYSVAPQPRREHLAELYELRLLLEPFAAQKCATTGALALVEHLGALNAEMLALADADGLDALAQFAQLDMAFHDLIAAHAGSSLLVEALARLHSHIHLFRVPDPRREMRRSISEHSDLIAAIAERAPERAAAAMARHIEHSRDRYIGS